MLSGFNVVFDVTLTCIIGGITTNWFKNWFWYKTETFSKVFNEWEKIHNIKKENQIVYHYTERINQTMRPNREIFIQKNVKKPKPPISLSDSIFIPVVNNGMHKSKENGFILFENKDIHRIDGSCLNNGSLRLVEHKCDQNEEKQSDMNVCFTCVICN